MLKTSLLIGSVLLLSMISHRHTRVVFFGDSITEMGAAKGGYIDLMQHMLEDKGLSDKYELIGAGVGGNKVYDLYLRMEDDVLSKNPYVVVIYVGINDVWHKQTYGTGTDSWKFEAFYKAMVKKLQAHNIRVIVCTPSAIGERTDFSNPQDGDLNWYAGIVRDVAKDMNCAVCDLRKAFLEYNLAHNPDNKESGILTVDGVHPNAQGNQLLADKLWDMIIAK